MSDEVTHAEVFLAFLGLARTAHERFDDEDDSAGVTLGMRVVARHGSCCSSHEIEAGHEASVHEL